MTKPKRTHHWFKPSLRNVFTNARTSVVVTVALLPSLLAQIFLYFNAVSPLTWIIAISVLMVVVFLLFLYLEWRTIPNQASGFIPDTLTQDQLSRIRGLVTVVSNMEKAGNRVVQTLISGIRTLEVVYCVTCEGDDGARQVRLLREWADKLGGRNLEIRTINRTPDRHKYDETVADLLSQELSHVQDTARLIVDVTADSKPMTLALHLAATRQGLPVTYIPSARQDHPGEAFALSVIRDPNGLFATEPATVA